MGFVPTEYCKVCEYFRHDLGSCKKGYKKFCDMKDFKPSILNAINYFIDEAEFYDKIDENTADELYEFARRKFR